MSSVEQHKDKQPLVKPSAVVATGLAAAVGAFLTSRFGVAGTVLGTALTTMIITAGSALFEVSMQRVADRARSAPAVVVRVRPLRGRVVLLGGLLAAVASFAVGMGAVTGVELSAGKSLSCWVWNQCPTEHDGTGAASEGAARTRPSILGGGQNTAAQPGSVEHPRQPAPAREQQIPDSRYAPQGRPAGGARSDPHEAPQPPAPPAWDAGPGQEPGVRPPAQERPPETPPDGQAPNERPSAPPHDSGQPVPSGSPPANRPPLEQPARPVPPWVYQQRPS